MTRLVWYPLLACMAVGAAQPIVEQGFSAGFVESAYRLAVSYWIVIADPSV